MSNKGSVLVVDDEDKLRALLRRIIALEGLQVFEAADLKTASVVLAKEKIDVVLCDVKLPDGNGVDFVKTVKEKWPMIEIILLTAFGNIAGGVEAIKNGAFNYLTKGDDNTRIIPLLFQAIEKKHLQERIQHLEQRVGQKYSFDNILGSSPLLKEAISLSVKVAGANTTVLLLGETGTGKEVFAQAIHNSSPRAREAFVALNCSSFSKELMESELFGYRAGAFTNAIKDKKGLMEQAHKGTLFLDEIGELPLDLQSKLLRVLETSEFIKIGDTNPTRVDIRIIAATNRNLQEASEDGKFREDLYYRLNVYTISLPALRDRKQDIPVLAKFFVELFSAKTNVRNNGMSAPFLHRLQEHHWPGNIRELKNAIERAVIVANGSELAVDHLPAALQEAPVKAQVLSAFDMNSVEKLHIQRVLIHTANNKSEAARLLNIGLATLYRKIEEYGIST